MAIGNGVNDVAMLERAAIGIAVLGPGGYAAEALRSADLPVKSIDDALCMVTKPRRLIATLRG
jgi:soluble P-type ATPase